MAIGLAIHGAAENPAVIEGERWFYMYREGVCHMNGWRAHALDEFRHTLVLLRSFANHRARWLSYDCC
jgi:hypothetical protein